MKKLIPILIVLFSCVNIEIDNKTTTEKAIPKDTVNINGILTTGCFVCKKDSNESIIYAENFQIDFNSNDTLIAFNFVIK